MDWEQILKIARKIGRLLVDTRFWVAVLFIGGNFLGSEEWVKDADPLSQDIVAAIQALWNALVSVVSLVMLLYSYTKRSPSGLVNPNEDLADRVAEKLAARMAEK